MGLKHGRVAMLASVGYLAGACGYTFPGEIAKGVSFASVNSDGVYNAWAKVPTEGKFQILLLILCLETANESKKPHYMRGGVPGRLAMIGIVSFLIGHNLPGSVPALNSAF